LWREINDDLTFHALHDDAVAGMHDKDWHVVDGLDLVVGRMFLLVASLTVPLALAAARDVGHEGIAKTRVL
jgi:hypothetical protein